MTIQITKLSLYVPEIPEVDHKVQKELYVLVVSMSNHVILFLYNLSNALVLAMHVVQGRVIGEQPLRNATT